MEPLPISILHFRDFYPPCMDKSELKLDISILFCSKNDPVVSTEDRKEIYKEINNEYGKWKLKRGLPEFLWRHASFTAEDAAKIAAI
jgi:hypothetical protein